MKQEFDDIALSSYVDGELDAESMQTIEAHIDNDPNARKYVINAIRTTARLRGSYNKILYEEIPENLAHTIISRPKKRTNRSPLIRIAAAVFLIVLGFGARSLIMVNGDGPFDNLSTPFPASFNQVVADAMEFNLSGAPPSVAVTGKQFCRHCDTRQDIPGQKWQISSRISYGSE